ncbi:MAG: hypothetical protein IJH88_01940 [Eggerthellaceae bacterium]|nr:hypothetical protein [Eggerthellaceae bacterium]
MEISKKREGNQLTITLAGELNTATAPDLEEVLADEVKADDTIIFDTTHASGSTTSCRRTTGTGPIHHSG